MVSETGGGTLVARPVVCFHYKELVKMELFGLYSLGCMVSALSSSEQNLLQWLPISPKHGSL